MEQRGEEITFELSTADASGGVVVTVYSTGRVARPIGATEQLFITDLTVSSATALVIDVYGGTGASPANGERIANVVTSATVGSFVTNQGSPIPVKRGVTPKVKASASGQLTITGQGFILRA